MRLINRTSALALFILSAGFGQAGLITSDFLSPGDNLLVTDTNTNLQWLKPSYTSSHTFDDAFVQNIISTYGFSYSDEPTVLNMINSNFGNPPVGSPGSPTGFTDAQNFFNVFGINEPTTCTVGMGTVPCPRTQGLTSTSTSAGTPRPKR